MKNLFVIIGVVALLAVCACGGIGIFSMGGLALVAGSVTPTAGSTTGSAPSGQVGKVGTPITSAGIELNAVKVETSAKEGITTAKPGNTLLLVQVAIKNTNKDKAPYNPLYFKVKDAGGFEYTSALIGREPSLKSGELTTGDSAAGWVMFEVPTEAKGLIMSYQPLVLFGGYQTIRIDLGR